QRGVAAHAQADDVRLLDLGCVEHGDRIALEERLAVKLLVGRAVRGWIAARSPGDAAPVAPEVAHLIFPAAVVAAELVDEQDRRAATGFLVVDARAFGWGIGHGASSAVCAILPPARRECQQQRCAAAFKHIAYIWYGGCRLSAA